MRRKQGFVAVMSRLLHWRHVRPVLLAAVFGMSCAASASDEAPPEIAALLPKAASLDSSSWGAFQTEFGVSFGADMRAEFPGFPSSCDFTIGPEMRVEIKGDTAWEEPPMLDMAVQMHESDIESARDSLPQHVAMISKSNGDVQSIGGLLETPQPDGTILAVEYTENCGKRPNGTNTVVNAFARKGATLLFVSLWISAGSGDAVEMVSGMLEAFRQLDFGPLLKDAQ